MDDSHVAGRLRRSRSNAHHAAAAAASAIKKSHGTRYRVAPAKPIATSVW
jgi:hypothetical protein